MAATILSESLMLFSHPFIYFLFLPFIFCPLSIVHVTRTFIIIFEGCHQWSLSWFRHNKQQSCNNFNVQMVILHLKSWTSQWCHPVRGVTAQVLTIQIVQLSKLPLYCEHQLSTLCSNENREALIVYSHLSIPSGINLDCCSTHPAITKIEKQF